MNLINEIRAELLNSLNNKFHRKLIENSPNRPMLTVYMGEKSADASDVIQNELRKVWKAKAENNVQLFCADGRYYETAAERDAPLDVAAIAGSVEKMFTCEQIYTDLRSGLLLVSVVSTADCADLNDFIRRYEEGARLRNQLKYMTPTVLSVVLLDETFKGAALAREVREYLCRQLDGDAEQMVSPYTVVLSVLLRNGIRLVGDTIGEVYSLIGKLLILLNSATQEYRPSIEGIFEINSKQFLTAAYSEIDRQNPQIVDTVLLNVLKSLSERDAQENEAGTDELCTELGIIGGHVKILDEYFNKEIIPNLPDPYVLEHLPVTVMVDNISSKTCEEFNNLTLGAFDQFFRQIFRDKMLTENNVRVKELKESLRSYIESNIPMTQAGLSLTDARIDSIIRNITIPSADRSMPISQYIGMEMKCQWMTVVSRLMGELLREYRQKASLQMKEVSNLYAEMTNVYNAGQDRQLEEYYGALAMQYLKGDKGRPRFEKIGTAGTTTKGIAQAVKDLILQMFQDEDIFSLPLDQEFIRRLGDQGMQVINQQLAGNLSERTFLQSSFAPVPGKQYFMLNSSSEELWMNLLRVNHNNSGTVMLDTGDSNSISVIQLYKCDSRSLL